MRKQRTSAPKIGAELRYRFILNPYQDARFTRCPQCDALMKVRKIPLLIHIEPAQLLVLRKTVKLCPTCDLLIVHQDELEQQLAYSFRQRVPEVIGNDYFVYGTVDIKDWKEGQVVPVEPKEMLDRAHPFKEQLKLEARGGWMPTDEPPPSHRRRKGR